MTQPRKNTELAGCGAILAIMVPFVLIPSLFEWSPAKADYQHCVTVKPGPIERPDGYNTHPYGRKKDTA